MEVEESGYRRTLSGLRFLFKEVSALLQCRAADETDILEDLYCTSPPYQDSYVGQETHLHFTLAELASPHVPWRQ